MKETRRRGQAAGLPILTLCFLAGVGLGQAASAVVPDSVGTELTEYLRGYLMLESAPQGAALSALVLYFRYPLAAVLLGCLPAGVILLPLLTAAFGFFLSFSVCCFTAAFGTEGILLALAVMGLRCLVSFPCYMLLAEASWESACALLRRGRGTPSAQRGRARWRLRCFCAALLLAAACLEVFCSPWILRLALGRLPV